MSGLEDVGTEAQASLVSVYHAGKLGTSHGAAAKDDLYLKDQKVVVLGADTDEGGASQADSKAEFSFDETFGASAMPSPTDRMGPVSATWTRFS